MKELISIIIPVYNNAKELFFCVETIWKQSYRPVEVIIVNDGSTDDFHGIVDKIKEDQRFSVLDIKFLTQENKGASSARNLGFQSSLGGFVIFWDADTIAKPCMIEKMHDALIQHPSSSYVYSKFKFGWKTMHGGYFDAKKLKENNFIDTTSLLRRSDFCGFDESLKRFQDWDLWLTLLEKNKSGIFIPEVLYTKTTRFGRGISSWLPSFAYHLPWKIKAVKDFESAREVVARKHGLAE